MMWKIRDAQVAALARGRRDDFDRRALGHVRQVLPGFTARYADGELLARIDSDVDLAARHGIELQSDVVRFIEFRLVYGDTFPDAPSWARVIVARRDLDGTAKMHALAQMDRLGRGR